MILGYHYHVPIRPSGADIMTPGYLGVFIDALAAQVDKLVLFMHEAPANQEEPCDYKVRGSNVILVNLGFKAPAWDRVLFPGKVLNRIRQQVAGCDALLVRAPSPLAPFFYHRFRHITKVTFLIVGDYAEGAKHLKQPWWRLWAIQLLLIANDRQLRQVLRHSLTFVNSHAQFQKYESFVKRMHAVSTTTLSKDDFFFREDTCTGGQVKLLFTGRYDPAKGLKELIEATSLLRQQQCDVSLHLVGWEDDPAKPVERYLMRMAGELGIAEQVIFHGKKSLGPELNEMYRMADVFTFPSYHEGFPRVIWEAMANSLPIVCTPVGGIPFILNNFEDALYTEVKNSRDLAEKIRLVISDASLRKKLITNAMIKAQDATMEAQARKIVQTITSDQQN